MYGVLTNQELFWLKEIPRTLDLRLGERAALQLLYFFYLCVDTPGSAAACHIGAATPHNSFVYWFG